MKFDKPILHGQLKDEVKNVLAPNFYLKGISKIDNMGCGARRTERRNRDSTCCTARLRQRKLRCRLTFRLSEAAVTKKPRRPYYQF